MRRGRPVVRVDAPRLGWTLAAMALATAPHALHVPAWPIAAAVLASTWRWLALRRGWRLPGMLLRLVLAIAGFIAVFAAYRTINGVDAGTALLIVMMAMKLTETNTSRDLVVLLFISLFLVVANFLYDQSPWSLLWAVPAVWLAVTALLQVSRENTPIAPQPALRASGGLLLQALPLMLIIWVLFPRVPGPFWALPSASSEAKTGLSDEMAPGSITQLTQSAAVAFRAVFDGALPPPSQRYWRGPVLRTFDGGGWKARQPTPYKPGTIAASGPSLDYTLYLEPHEQRWLFALDMLDPGAVPPYAVLTNEFQLTSRKRVSNLLRYEMRSYPTYQADPGMPPWSRRPYLELPRGRNPRTAALAAEWRREAARPEAIVQRALSMFRNDNFVYTLQPPPLDVRGDPVDQFLFDTQRGFCEHYASAFAVLMRNAGIPARIVTGYLGGTENPINGLLTVRQSDAHAWAEVWIAGRGWLRIDPTGAVAPERIESGLGDALPLGESLPGLAFADSELLWRLRHGWDAAAAKWNKWILGYGQDTQASFLKWLGLDNPNLRNLLLTLTVAVSGLLGAFSLWLALRARPAPPDPVATVYNRFCARLARKGVARGAAEGPLDFARRAAEARPAAASDIVAITRLYLALRYSAAPANGDLASLKRSVRALRL
ncbi:MAG: DUF3488 and transglutaminase-like domain-containing protein [Pseudomonadota bacterium]